ncbi:MAG TPA: hypothetical protein IAC26_01885 [Candidatus Scatomorpha stercoravium]|nr:hypothetical protein [Candidatus Scatomorpha stercoravium]
MNADNLIPLDRRTKDEQRKIQSMGGVASGIARRRRKALSEALGVYLSLPVQDKRALGRLVKAGVDAEDADTQMLVVAALVQRAIDGDVRAVRLIFDIVGTSDEKAADVPADDPITEALKEEFGEDAF